MEQLIGMPAAGAGPDGEGALIKDSSIETFMEDVIDASSAVPVIVDFWAPWCGPCKQLGPVLEKAVKEAKGAVRLVKVDIDRNQELAMQMRIQSIPAVYAFFQGRPVDGFVGAVPESQVRAFVQRLVKAAGGAPAGPSPVEQALEQAEGALGAGDAGTAAALFDRVLAHEPDNVKAVAGLVRALVALGELDRARQTLARVPANATDPAIGAARAALELADQAASAKGDELELVARLERDPDDHQARFDLAMALQARGKQAEAMEELLTLVKRGRQWNEEAGRKQLLKLFEALGPTHPLTVAGRRKLSSILFA
ncbi:MAG: thioredoxin [Rhodospirillaceae bacterium]|nr:thioredoxin [Rhodospirillaceae bacterium]